MSDWLIVRIPFDDPNRPVVVEELANVPLDWHVYLKQVAHRVKKPGRYLVANFLYRFDYFMPERKKKLYQKVERESGDFILYGSSHPRHS